MGDNKYIMNDQTKLFSEAPITKAVLSLAVPAVITQLITVAYNMADTFFIGQIGDSGQVAAASICLPMFMVITAFANICGIGGASLVARSFGQGDPQKVKKVSAFAVWCGIGFALLYSLVNLVFGRKYLYLIGCNDDIYDYCRQYQIWTVVIGACPTLLNSLLSHLVRSEGYSKQASFGVALGGVLNIILDPVFIRVFGLEIKGAAIATCISNLIAAAYYILFILRTKDLTISLNPAKASIKGDIPKEVMLVGLPSFLMTLLAVTSNIVLNKLLAAYCNEAIAGAGIAKKIDMLMFAVANGISQGVLPLIGYNFASKNHDRMIKSIKTSFFISLSLTIFGSVGLFFGAKFIIKSFIDDALTVYYGTKFQRIMCSTGACISVSSLTVTSYQAMGEKKTPLFLSVLRKGALDIPAMILLNKAIGVFGVAWGIPVADVGAMLVSLAFLLKLFKKISKISMD